MSETAISVSDAAKDFMRVIERVERRQESALLVRDGQPVARLVPCCQPAATAGELAERWAQLDRLSPEEAAAFADDLEGARQSMPGLKSAWD